MEASLPIYIDAPDLDEVIGLLVWEVCVDRFNRIYVSRGTVGCSESDESYTPYEELPSEGDYIAVQIGPTEITYSLVMDNDRVNIKSPINYGELAQSMTPSTLEYLLDTYKQVLINKSFDEWYKQHRIGEP